MKDRRMWVVRAAGGGRLFEEFKEKSVVAIGWGRMGDLRDLKNRDGVVRAVRATWPEYSDGKAIITGAQLYRFAFEMSVGDRVVTYDPSRRTYLVGTIQGDYKFDPKLLGELENVRKVAWEGEVKRDQLLVATKNSLGAISSLFLVPPEAGSDIEAALKGGPRKTQQDEEPQAEAEIELLVENEDRAKEFIKDKLNKLDWEEMQELVAAILRAMGYKTRVSPSGPDQGKDIVASPDGLGFENPRIVVEVKHRSAAMGAQAIRSFLGGRH
jgi:restriction system protein